MKKLVKLKSLNSKIRAKGIMPTLHDAVIWVLFDLLLVIILKARISLFIPEFTAQGPLQKKHSVNTHHSFHK